MYRPTYNQSGIISANSGSATIAATSTEVLKQEPRRRRVTFVNDSDSIIYLSKGGIAITNSGIRLNASGGSYEDVEDSKGYIYRGPYYAISDGAGHVLTYVEEVYA